MKKIFFILIPVILICSIGSITRAGQANRLEIETTDFISTADHGYVSIGDNDYGISVGGMGAYEEDPVNQILFNYLPIVSNPCPFLYFDNFSDPTSGWPIIDTDDALQEYNQGEYRIVVRSTEDFVHVRSGFKAVDYRVSVDLRNVTDVIGSYGYGIIFVAKPDESGWYSLEIYPDGWFGIYRYYYQISNDQYNWETLYEEFSPAIHQGTQSNNISIERNGSAITAYANGQLLTSINNSYLMGEDYLGLINFTYDQRNVDIRYDNFKVTPAGCVDHQSLSKSLNMGQPGWIEQVNDNDKLQTSLTKHIP